MPRLISEQTALISELLTARFLSNPGDLTFVGESDIDSTFQACGISIGI